MSEPALAVVEAPDFAEPIESWRVWRVVLGRDGYRLGSVIKPTLWPAGEPLVAECRRTPAWLGWFRRRGSTRHASPEELCQCGIYAAALPSLEQYLRDRPVHAAVARVVGRVALWGTVVACDRGYRASHAYPQRIYVPVDAAFRSGHSSRDVVEGLAPYGIPVELLPARCNEALGLLERIQRVSVQHADA